MNIIDKLTIFLEEENIIPVSEDNWSILQLTHCCPTDDQMRKELYSFIKDKVGKKSGIYVYMKDGNCLYVGKAKQLYDRIKSHYIESFSPVPGDTKDMRWHRFFTIYQ